MLEVQQHIKLFKTDCFRGGLSAAAMLCAEVQVRNCVAYSCRWKSCVLRVALRACVRACVRVCACVCVCVRVCMRVCDRFSLKCKTILGLS